MEKLTENQIKRINNHMSKMTESQQDAYIKKLEEAGLIDKIMATFGSPKANINRLVKQRQASIKQLEAMKNVINSSNNPNTTPEVKQQDIAAIDAIIQKLNGIDLNIQIDETPVNNANQGDNANGDAANADNNGNNNAQ